ncbi:NAD(P)H-dependent oxidoreductase [Romboutsia ilealis]|uniref:NAD(P)H-dependent oxidoreductase n=1 Tax=Romboutsia faecis TaxID=2764597 RepID=A0ABR7JNP0_9FIRM|nr:NAD(P)H-dependent oxidoreductase [Romboutsia faecis]MBC5996524.1 NAD(P)H-dependent oxidoreductase [Romboutsia faecis]MRN24050.1 NAD(P)H-dependent oxidoreductase [Romboutsia ilealis]
MNKNEVIDILNFRHACKEFDPNKKISSENLEVIIEGGRLAPSSIGIEPWHFLVIENQELKDELSKVCFGGKTQIPTCSHFIIYLTRTPKEIRSDSEYINYLLKDVQHLPDDYASNMRNFMKSAEDMIGDDENMQSYANEQTYIALSSMMLSAAMLNIDSCTIGGIDRDAVEKILIDRNLLDKEKFRVTVGCTFGYRVHDSKPKLRQPLNEVFTLVK